MSICMSAQHNCKIKPSRNYSCIRFNTFQLLALQETVELLQSELHGTQAELIKTQSELHGTKTEVMENQMIIAALQRQQTFQMSE